jgi:hypothetical protein
MPGLVPGIHGFDHVVEYVDGRDEPGHDDGLDINYGQDGQPVQNPVDSLQLLIRLRACSNLKDFSGNARLVGPF